MTTATKKTFYGVLGVAEDASQDEIRKAYLKLAHRYHPDKTGGNKAAEERLKEINEAYDTLKNPEKRKQYDAMRSAGGPFGADAGPYGFDGGADSSAGFGFGGPGGVDFEDILGSFFGGRASTRATSVRRGRDVEASVSITLEEAATGTTRGLKMSRDEPCPVCSGAGHEPGHVPETCPACHGTGQLRQGQAGFAVLTVCSQCRGTGKIVTHPCGRCHGSGHVRARRELSVTIPAGAESGTRLRLKGEGEPGRGGGPNGDLYVVVTVQPHALFERDGADLVCEVPITLTDAVLGGTVKVPTLDGLAELKIPEGTQTGAKLRMRGLGLPEMGKAQRGDEIIRTFVEIPTKLNRRQREILRELGGATLQENYPKHFGFLERIRRLGKK